LLPIVIAFVILVPCILYSFEIIPTNIYLFAVPFLLNKDSLNQNTYANERGDMVSITAESVYHNLRIFFLFFFLDILLYACLQVVDNIEGV
jgi:hypothetical protein